MHQHTQQTNVDIFKQIFSSLLNQSHVTFQPWLYPYGCVLICKWGCRWTDF